jgi:hypothetical protein
MIHFSFSLKIAAAREAPARQEPIQLCLDLLGLIGIAVGERWRGCQQAHELS